MRAQASRHQGIKASRAGFALVDVIIGGVLLSVGLAAIISLTARGLARQTDGERRMTAAWLADEILNMVVVEGPAEYGKIHDTSGRFEFPFDEFEFDVIIQEQGTHEPYRVFARIFWDEGQAGRIVEVESLIAERGGEEQERAPLEPVDREERWYERDNPS